MSENLPADSRGKMVVFGAKQIRRIWVDGQWFFSVVDIIAVLTDSDNPRNYWNMMKARERKESEVQLSTFCVQLDRDSPDSGATRGFQLFDTLSTTETVADGKYYPMALKLERITGCRL